MVEQYIKAYGIAASKMQEYLQRIFPDSSIVVNVSNLYYTHLLPGVFPRHTRRLGGGGENASPDQGSQTTQGDSYAVDLPQELSAVSLIYLGGTSHTVLEYDS